MTDLLGQPLFEVWQKLCVVIDEKIRNGTIVEC